MKVCVLQPDYSTADVDYKNYDPPRDLTSLLPGDTVHHIFLNKLHTYKQLKNLSNLQYDIFVNLCEGYLEWAVPSIDVPYFLDTLQLPYTGPEVRIYDPPKELMKYVAYTASVATPAYAIVNSINEIKQSTRSLSFPMFLKPSKAGDSLGIDTNSLVRDYQELKSKAVTLLAEFDEIIIENYIAGREFTVLVIANEGSNQCRAYQPIEYIFPGDMQFKTYDLKTKDLHPGANIPCNDPELAEKLKSASTAIFKAFEGVGYARLDFRVDSEGQLFFLEINFTCSVFYTNGYEGSADYILKNDEHGQSGFLKNIIREGISRYEKKHKCYKVRGDAISGYGIYATRPLREGTVIFEGECQSQRVVSLNYIRTHWSEAEQLNFRRYAYPVNKDVFLLWDNDPGRWAPQNHHCDPNTKYDGLNVVASKDIEKDVELTLDYATFLDNNMEPFQCNCGSANCRGVIQIQ